MIFDKKCKFHYLFRGFRKHKYNVIMTESFTNFSKEEFSNFHIFIIVLYDFRDVFDLLLIYTRSTIILAAENPRILKKAKLNGIFHVIDLKDNNITIQLHECIHKFLD